MKRKEERRRKELAFGPNLAMLLHTSLAYLLTKLALGRGVGVNAEV